MSSSIENGIAIQNTRMKQRFLKVELISNFLDYLWVTFIIGNKELLIKSISESTSKKSDKFRFKRCESFINFLIPGLFNFFIEELGIIF
jgi:hypothetical protein